MADHLNFDSELVKAREELKKAQRRVAELEQHLHVSQLSSDSGYLPSDNYDQYQRLFDAFTDGREVIGFDWRYLYVNDVAARYNRRPKQELIGHKLQDIHKEIEKTAVFKAFQRCMQDRTTEHVEQPLRPNDNVETWLELTIYPIPDGILVTIANVTKRKMQERELQFSSTLQASMSDAVIVTDMTFRIQRWNKAASRIYGWTAEEVIQKNTVEVLQTEYLSNSDLESSRDLLREQGWWQGEVIQRRKDGTRCYILGSVTLLKNEVGASIGVVAVNKDITEHKQAEIALHTYAAEIEDLYNNAPCGYHSIDSYGVIRRINDTELRWLGYQREELVGKRRLREILTPSSAAIFDENFPIIKERGWMTELELELIRKDGSIMPCLVNVTAIFDNDGHFIRSRTTLFDITTLKKTQQALIDSESRYRLLAEHVRDVIVRLDARGIRTFVTPSCTPLLGYAPDELIGKPGIELTYPDDRISTQAAFQNAIKQGHDSFTLAHRVSHKDGRPIWVELMASIVRDPESGAMVEVIGVIRDISERRRAEDALRESEERYRLVAENVSDVLGKVNLRGIRTFISPSCYTLIGYHAEELIGRPALELVHPDDIAVTRAKMEEARRVRTSNIAVIQRLQHKDGHYVWTEVVASPIRNPETGQPDEFIVVIRDVTERKQAEIALQQALQKEKELNELKSRFVSMASHEFRTPLASILAVTETLTFYRHKLSDEKVSERLHRIQEQVQHLTAIMEDVLMLSRIQSGHLEFHPLEANLDILCRTIVDEFQNLPTLQHPIDYSCSGDIRDAMLDPKLMRQVVTNLVSNAIKYSPIGSTVHIGLEFGSENITLKIRDEGIGIPETDLIHLFEAFYRATNVGAISGTGLGLMIIKEAVELHGGTITVESQVGVGTVFTVTLPFYA